MLIYFYLGELEWQKTDSINHDLIKEMKTNIIYNTKILLFILMNNLYKLIKIK